MTVPIGNKPRAAPLAATPPSSTTGSVKLDVTGQSPLEDVAKALGQVGMNAEDASSYARQIGTIMLKDSRTKVFEKVEAKVNDYIKAHPNATKEEIAKEAKTCIAAQTFMYKYLEKNLQKMATESIARMRNTFSGNF